MEKGTIFEARSSKYKLQKITKEGVFASKVVDGDKCRRGRPTKLTFEEVANSLGVSVEELTEKLNKPEIKNLPRPVELVQKVNKFEDEAIKFKSKEEKRVTKKEKLEIQKKLIASLRLYDNSTVDDWK